MNLNKITARYNRLILGENRFAPLRKRVFILILWVSIILAVLGNAVNIIMGFPLSLIILTSVIILILLFLFLRIRKNQSFKYEISIYIFWGIIVLSIPPIWILNGGIDSNNIMLIFVIFISMFLTVKPSHRFPTYVFFFVLGISVLLLDYLFPQLIVRYTDRTQRIVDLILGDALYITIGYALLNLLVKNTEYEQERITTRNRQLDKLTRKADMLNRQLEESVAELAESNISKDRFISIISHDLRSPFQGLLGISRMLEDDYDELDDKERKELIEKLKESIEKQYGFLEELLLWGRIQRNVIQIEKEIVSIGELIRSLLRVMEDTYRRKNISVELAYCDNDEILIDRQLTATVFRNIISNAVKFSHKNGKIFISIAADQNKSIVTIQDFGIGMSENDLSNIFKPEKSISRRGTDGEIGTGLGLIVCGEIIEKLGYSMNIKSEEGEGTVFSIELPGD